MEHFNGMLFRKSGPGNKQHTNQPTNMRLNLKYSSVMKFSCYNTICSNDNLKIKGYEK